MVRALLALVLCWLALVPPSLCLCAATDHDHAHHDSDEVHEPWCPEVTGGDAAAPTPPATADLPAPAADLLADDTPAAGVALTAPPRSPSPPHVPIYISLGVLRN